MKMNLKLILLLCLLTACGKQKVATKHNLQYGLEEVVFIGDIMGNEANDTIIIKPHPKIINHKILFYVQNNTENIICEIKFRNDSVEKFYIEGNNIGSKDKGLRLIIRNTSFIPDYCYIDVVQYENVWSIIGLGTINTNTNAELSSCYSPTFGDFKKYGEPNDEKSDIINIKQIVIRNIDNNIKCN